MNERLLQYIWQQQYFNRDSLESTESEPIKILAPGKLNTHQGPDFSAARIRIGETEWAGNVELHIKTDDWLRHGHQHDQTYDNVILHVVWEHTRSIDSSVPVLELQGRVPALLKDDFLRWMQNMSRVPCEAERTRLGIMPGEPWKEQLVRDRLETKASLILSNLEFLTGHWEEVFWWQVARNFGYSVNADAFEEMARSLPLSMVSRHRNLIQQVEALLLGQCGLLGGKYEDPYALLLQREYRFLRHKYGLSMIRTPVKFLRMRPSNFPTVRLAQLSMLIHGSHQLFSVVRELHTIGEVRALFSITANDFWHYHYRLDKSADFMQKTLGKTMVDNIIINTVIPTIYAYGKHRQDNQFIEKSLRWLHETSAEMNTVTRIFFGEGNTAVSAFDTQAVLELEKNYCAFKRCLECEIGRKLLTEEG